MVIDEMWELNGDLLRPGVEIMPGGNRYGSRTGTLHGLSEEQVTERLGFEPAYLGDDKRSIIWRFRARIEDGPISQCAIWDYKGARFSTGGASDVFRALFEYNYSPLGKDEDYGYRF